MYSHDDFRVTRPLAAPVLLSPQGARWLGGLPVPMRPLITAKRHPHIVNRLSQLWGRADELDHYMGELLVSSRPNRRGFAPEVLEELLDLHRALMERRSA